MLQGSTHPPRTRAQGAAPAAGLGALRRWGSPRHRPPRGAQGLGLPAAFGQRGAQPRAPPAPPGCCPRCQGPAVAGGSPGMLRMSFGDGGSLPFAVRLLGGRMLSLGEGHGVLDVQRCSWHMWGQGGGAGWAERLYRTKQGRAVQGAQWGPCEWHWPLHAPLRPAKTCQSPGTPQAGADMKAAGPAGCDVPCTSLPR